jgi:hypothetical protein
VSYISNRHRSISESLGNPEILTDPEKYFGSNYKILLNAWIYRESLNIYQRNEYQIRWDRLGWEIHQKQRVTAGGDLLENFRGAYWENEIVRADKILESGGQLYSVPLLTHSEVATRRDVWRF